MSKKETEIIVKKNNPWTKIILLVAVIIGGILLLWLTPLGTYLKDVDFIREQVGKVGMWGFLIYILLFVGVASLAMPLTFLMAISVLVFGTWEGIILTYIATLISSITTFYLGKWMGGGSLSGIKNKWVHRAIAQAERNPIRTIVIMRTFMQLSPLIGYSLALTKIRPKRYIIGNVIGILVPIFYLGLAFILMEERVIAWMGVQN